MEETIDVLSEFNEEELEIEYYVRLGNITRVNHFEKWNDCEFFERWNIMCE